MIRKADPREKKFILYGLPLCAEQRLLDLEIQSSSPFRFNRVHR